jgi:AraC-like DNA-binding protein
MPILPNQAACAATLASGSRVSCPGSLGGRRSGRPRLTLFELCIGDSDSEDSTMPLTTELRNILQQLVPRDGEYPTAIPSLWLIRQSSSGRSPCGTLFPTLSVTAQGQLEVLLGEKVYSSSPGQHLVSATELPVSARTVGATRSNPYLGLRLHLDRGVIRSLIEEAQLGVPIADPAAGRLQVEKTSQSLLDSVLRLVRLLQSPTELAVLAPMVERELLLRLLLGESAVTLHRVAQQDGQAQRIKAAIAWLRKYFRDPFRVDDLARRAGMSASSFRQWFRSITGMSPLQYQKELRLQEARRLLRGDHRDVGTVSRAVGYESSSQFSREYRRLFGNPPAREIDGRSRRRR